MIDVLDPKAETPEIVRERTLRAARFIPLAQLDTTNCGFSPYRERTSTTHDTAFTKIRSRVVHLSP